MGTEPRDNNEDSSNKPGHADTAVDLQHADIESEPHFSSEPFIKKKKSNKFLWISVIILVVLLVGGVSLILYLRHQAELQAEADKAASAPTHFSSASDLVKQVRPQLTGEILETIVSNGEGGKTANGYGTYGVPSYTVSTRSYENMPAASTGVGYIGSSIVEAANYTTLTNFFKTNKFKQVSSGTDKAGPLAWNETAVTYLNYATYESPDMLCMTWHVDATPLRPGTHITSVGCADKSSYESAAKVLDPFYAAYSAGDVKPGKGTILAVPTAGNGAKGYKNAVLLLEDPSQWDGRQTEALFYQKPGKTDWNYFLSTRGYLLCSAFNTDELKQAFNGLPCSDDQTNANSQVK